MKIAIFSIYIISPAFKYDCIAGTTLIEKVKTQKVVKMKEQSKSVYIKLEKTKYPEEDQYIGLSVPLSVLNLKIYYEIFFVVKF